MLTTRVHIDGQVFLIDPSHDIQQLRADVLTASRDTGYVHFECADDRSISVLMGPGICATFETRPVSDDERSSSADDLVFLGFDDWPDDVA